jgi:hypothetical protein
MAELALLTPVRSLHAQADHHNLPHLHRGEGRDCCLMVEQ